MSEIKQTFTATDGETFDTMAEAEQHNKFIEAEKAFSDAWDNLRQTVIDGFKTADGYGLNESATYWWKETCYLIRGRYFSRTPEIMEISLYVSNIRSITVKENDIEIRAEIFGMKDDMRFSLSDLYKKKENAEKEIVNILKDNIQRNQIRIAEIEGNQDEK